MDSFRITLPHARHFSAALPFALRARPLAHDLELHYHFSYTDLLAPAPPAEPDGDATLAIEAQFESHLNRQAMLGAQALLRGDDEGEQVW